MLSKILKKLLLFYLGGSFYYFIEMIYRGYSDVSMFLLAGFCIVFLIDPINDKISWDIDYRIQVLISTILCTFAEGVCGLIVNVWLQKGVWNYSHLPGTFFFGQCNLLFMGAWALIIAFIAIPIADSYDYYICGIEPIPYYRIGKYKIRFKEK